MTEKPVALPSQQRGEFSIVEFELANSRKVAEQFVESLPARETFPINRTETIEMLAKFRNYIQGIRVALPSSPAPKVCPECGSESRRYSFYVKNDPADASVAFTAENSHICRNVFHGESVPSTPSPTCPECGSKNKNVRNRLTYDRRGTDFCRDSWHNAGVPSTPVETSKCKYCGEIVTNPRTSFCKSTINPSCYCVDQTAVATPVETASPFEKEWLAQDKILDFRNWLESQLTQAREELAHLHKVLEAADPEWTITRLRSELERFKTTG